MVAAEQPIYLRCRGDNSAAGDQTLRQNEKRMKSPGPVMTSENWAYASMAPWRNMPFEALDIRKLAAPSDQLPPQYPVDH
jgi:hypothetical protein